VACDRSIDLFWSPEEVEAAGFYLCRSLESKKTEALLGFGSSSSAKRRTTRSKWKRGSAKTKGEGRNSSRCGVRWNGVGKELRVF